jgi:hypothetical protein
MLECGWYNGALPCGPFGWRGMTSLSIMLDGDRARKTHQIIWQKLFEYARIAWDVMRKEAERVVMYDDMIGKYDKI